MEKKYLILSLLLLVIIVLLTGCTNQISNNEYKFTESFTKQYQIYNNTTLSISTTNGNINISGWDDQKIKVNGIKRARTKEDLKNLYLQVNIDNNTITFNVTHKTGQWNDEAIDLHLKVPYNVSIENLNSTNGNVEVYNMRIMYATDTINGAISMEISEIHNPIFLQSINGKIDVYVNTSINATFDMFTKNGRVIINDIPLNINDKKYDCDNFKIGFLGEGGHSIDIKSTNGDIELHTFPK